MSISPHYSTPSEKPTWIWYPGDFEIWLGNRFNNRRTERGAMFPPFWKQDSHWATVELSTPVSLTKGETIRITAEGNYNLMIDGKLQFGMPREHFIPAGHHTIHFKIHNPVSPPALFVEGDTIFSGGHWLATYEDKIWIDEQGVAHGCGIYVPAAHADFHDAAKGPSTYALPRCVEEAEQTDRTDGLLARFAREAMGYLILRGIHGHGDLHIHYGESIEEALDGEHCETLDHLRVDSRGITDLAIGLCTPFKNDGTTDYTLTTSKAFRYVHVTSEGEVSVRDVALDLEYAPFDPSHSGRFACSDELLNHIWEVAAHTMDLTTREFFVDGIKRDRWTWSGDAIQSYLMNYYLRFDTACVKRTIRQLRGKDPVTSHINTIMDYTFYWFKSIHDYWLFTGDTDFVREMYPRMRTLMAYCLQRTNEEGMAEGQPDDWIFVDWVDFPMHKRGTLCFEQILFCKALEVMAACAQLLHDTPMANPPQGSLSDDEYAADTHQFGTLAAALRAKLKPTFWNEEQQAFMHAIEDGQLNPMVTRFPNMFAILYGYADETQRHGILHQVLLNDRIDAITTPYMRFYELEALCMMGNQPLVLQEIKAYWGGMLREGATTFWEKYNPEEHGRQHLAMYGRPYGKSLCHAWGASPLYLLGRYFLGVEPTGAGYSTYVVRPCLGGLEWMEGEVPTPFGRIHVKADQNSITVHSDGGHGTLILGQQYVDIPAGETLTIPLNPTTDQ